MAKDDYYVIAYQILTYLYRCLKQDIDAKAEYLKNDSPLFKCEISENYWRYIIKHLYEQGFIEGLVIDDTINNAPAFIWKLEKTEITPHGIEFLNENSLMTKARNFLKDAKDIIPGA